MKPIFYVSNIHFWFMLYNRPVQIASEVGKIRTKLKFLQNEVLLLYSYGPNVALCKFNETLGLQSVTFDCHLGKMAYSVSVKMSYLSL